MLTKDNPTRSKRIRDAARGQSCAIRLPGVCSYDDTTTVFCHFSYASSGMGMKPSDLSGSFGCAACHSVVDGRTKRPHGLLLEDIEWCKARGMAETWQRLIEMDIVAVKGAK